MPVCHFGFSPVVMTFPVGAEKKPSQIAQVQACRGANPEGRAGGLLVGLEPKPSIAPGVGQGVLKGLAQDRQPEVTAGGLLGGCFGLSRKHGPRLAGRA